VVESVAPLSAPALAGIEPQDVLLQWTFQSYVPTGQPRSGTLDNPLDLLELSIEVIPRGEVTLEGLRQGRPLTWRIRSTGSLIFGLELRPVRPDTAKISPRLAATYRLRYAFVASYAGQTEAADRAFEEAAEILRHASDPSGHALALIVWAHQLSALGELARSRERFEQALALEHRRDGADLAVAYPLFFLGDLADRQGDLPAAERAWLERLALLEKVVPESLEVALILDNLGYLSLWRGDTATAEERLNRAEAIERPFSDSLLYAHTLNKLALLAQDLGDLERAEALQQRVLALDQRWEPGSVDYGGALMNLATTLILRGELASAEDLLRQSVELFDQPGGDPRETARPRNNLGELALYRGDLAAAQSYFELALNRLRTGPESVELAGVYTNLAEVASRQQRFGLDLQRSRLGGSLESRGWFESETEPYAFDCLSARMARGRSAAAFQALEHGKTRVFLQLLAERDLRFAELPSELKTERGRLDAEYDRILTKLAQTQTGPDSPDERTGLRARLGEIKAAREALLARLQLQSPRLAALQTPAPMDLAEARRALDPGTVLLAFAVGSRESYLFVVRPSDKRGDGLEVHRLPIGKAALEKKIEVYRRFLTHPQSDLAKLNRRAARLYDLLLRPAETRLAGASRILISADGPLHRLPWAALRRHGRYLAEWRPIHCTASATVYGETRWNRRPASDPGSWRLVAFGDPEYPGNAGTPSEPPAVGEVRSALRRGLNLEPLPAARDEIRGIAELFPGAEIYLGREATEEQAKQAAPRADLLHFATHGLIDERFPLDSALALTLPVQPREGQDNGLLQAWEIFETVRLKAHLVTLSACDTALGREMGGEGILGLTRAFQFAGAHSVLASLWSVADVSTAKLMERFYTYLREGRPKDEALRAAQLDLLRSAGGELAHPYHWAGFALYGDWR